jgi:hypothetical protein
VIAIGIQLELEQVLAYRQHVAYSQHHVIATVKCNILLVFSISHQTNVFHLLAPLWELLRLSVAICPIALGIQLLRHV